MLFTTWLRMCENRAEITAENNLENRTSGDEGNERRKSWRACDLPRSKRHIWFSFDRPEVNSPKAVLPA